MPRLRHPLNDAPSDIYNTYVSYCNDINAKIHAIDSLDADKRAQANVISDRQFLASAIGILTPIYQKDYRTATLAQFIQDTASIEDQVMAAFSDAMGPSNPYSLRIHSDLLSAQNLLQVMSSDLNAMSQILNSSGTLKVSLDALKSQIDLMLPGESKDKALLDYSRACSYLFDFSSLANSAQAGFQSLFDLVSNLSITGGVYDKLQALAMIPDPVAQNADSADALLSQIGSVKDQDGLFQTNTMTAVNAAFADVKAAIMMIQQDVNPTPISSKIENACWYIDWTSNTFNVPEGVNLVNIFVGQITVDQAGRPAINGFGNLEKLNQLDAFVSACSAKNIPVKVSIGGHGGMYDNCWDVLNDTNVKDFASMLGNFCKTHNLYGIDFDFEKDNPTLKQQQLVGLLIKEFKTQYPDFSASLCTNASFAAWSNGVKNVMDQTIVSGKSVLDKLYVMSYYDPISLEEGWLSQWAGWIKTTYGLDSSQLTVGIDDFDAHAYDIGQISAYAAKNGMSTGYWAYNPGTPDSSNASCLKILQSYNAQYLKDLKDKPLKTATKLQKLFSFLKWAFNGFFVRAPKFAVSSLKTAFTVSKPHMPLAWTVPLPSAPYELDTAF